MKKPWYGKLANFSQQDCNKICWTYIFVDFSPLVPEYIRYSSLNIIFLFRRKWAQTTNILPICCKKPIYVWPSHVSWSWVIWIRLEIPRSQATISNKVFPALIESRFIGSLSHLKNPGSSIACPMAQEKPSMPCAPTNAVAANIMIITYISIVGSVTPRPALIKWYFPPCNYPKTISWKKRDLSQQVSARIAHDHALRFLNCFTIHLK